MIRPRSCSGAGGPKPKRRPIGQTIGGIFVGFDEQVWRHQPPADELVHHARPDDAVPAKDGTMLRIELPTDEPHAEPNARRPSR